MSVPCSATPSIAFVVVSLILVWLTLSATWLAVASDLIPPRKTSNSRLAEPAGRD
jgi:hypothetical protein